LPQAAQLRQQEKERQEQVLMAKHGVSTIEEANRKEDEQWDERAAREAREAGHRRYTNRRGVLMQAVGRMGCRSDGSSIHSIGYDSQEDW
jgi:hypothetical protein